MTLVNPTQINPNDAITAAGANLPHNQIADVLNGNIDDDNIDTISGTKISSGTLPASAATTDSNVETRMYDSLGDFWATNGGVWSQTSGLTGTMTAATAYIDGKRLSIASIASKAFTASKDTYISFDNVGAVTYSEVANGATAPTIGNNLLDYKVVTDGTAITSAVDLRPMSRSGANVLATSTFNTSSATAVQITGMTLTINNKTSRRIKLIATFDNITAGAVTTPMITFWDGVVGSGTQVGQARGATIAASGYFSSISATIPVPAFSGTKTFTLGGQTSAATSTDFAASSTAPNVFTWEPS